MYLDDGVHVGKEVTGTDIQQHDEGTTHVLTYLRILVPSHCKQTLRKREREMGEGYNEGGKERERENNLHMHTPSHGQGTWDLTLMKGKMFSTSAEGILMMN